VTYTYKFLDCGNRKKIEKFGDFILIRPCPQAIWKPFNPSIWTKFDSEFVRIGSEKGTWQGLKLPKNWEIITDSGLKWTIEPNDFGNVGIFTEHWTYTADLFKFFNKNEHILDLFSYSGSNIIELLQNGYKATAVDSSKSAMESYTKNLENNNISRDGQRLILEDAIKFVAREVRREKKYGSVMVDAPSFGRGNKGEVFDIDQQLVDLFVHLESLLKPDGKLVLTLHSPRFTIEGLKIFLGQIFKNKKIEPKEILNQSESGVGLPSGIIIFIS
jgi:23S rRNA (cytosine1962-C5)-methyltransferase